MQIFSKKSFTISLPLAKPMFKKTMLFCDRLLSNKNLL
ncbi:hypothetical protein X875_4340 [Mannheimia varigena USDA-ARS-USMARC-1388]|uniref:Uncharacterized protein n=1 Tax=Mannheimia varigena USDA-ARS-USMARC-1296 TaxID=1433287 RepID=W0QG37_9PAST|nr:hypothetical protein X808_16730 [Mannheimia varigena USDA-ARS-USMARC-1296]AHG79054.1 hypothetical protein X875_4340 [Mannheimia varigena USDA-ARS-USMARC-1388]